MTKRKITLAPATLAVQSGMEDYIVPPIATSKTDPWRLLRMPPRHPYSRSSPDPTVEALENLVSSLHDGAEAIAIGSGQAATAAILFTVVPGGHIIAGKQIYGGTRRFIENGLSKWASYTLVDPRSTQQLEDAVQLNTRYLLIETPTNPLLDIVDLKQIQRFSNTRNIPYILDNTFATMALLDGFQFGAEVVYYSASKYLGGHHDAIGGIIITKNRQLAERIRQNRKDLGSAISPDAAYRVHRGMATLELRMGKHCENAQIIVEYLAQHPMVSKVYYPGLPSHPGHKTAKRQMKNFGGIVSFEVDADYNRFANAIAAQDPHVIYLTESLGSVMSLLAHPASMSHNYMTPEQRKAIGINDQLFRLSVGIGDPKDITNSLERAFDAAKSTPTK